VSIETGGLFSPVRLIVTDRLDCRRMCMTNFSARRLKTRTGIAIRNGTCAGSSRK
jgi:hypothetical protein